MSPAFWRLVWPRRQPTKSKRYHMFDGFLCTTFSTVLTGLLATIRVKIYLARFQLSLQGKRLI